MTRSLLALGDFRYLFNELIKIKAEIRIKGDTNKDQMDLLGKRLHQYSE
jgi:hypothetical protein